MRVLSRDSGEAVQKVKGIEFANYNFKNKTIEAVKVKKNFKYAHKNSS